MQRRTHEPVIDTGSTYDLTDKHTHTTAKPGGRDA
jgi:hypothetical protein